MCFIQFDVVALGVVLARLRAAAFRAVGGRLDRAHRLQQQVVELERLDEIRVPDQRAVADCDVAERREHLLELIDTLLQRIAGAKHGRMSLHHALHLEPDLRRRRLALRVAQLVEPRDGLVAGARRERPRPSAALDELAAPLRRRAAEHDEIDQRVRAEPIGAVHGDARSLADRHEPRHDLLLAVAVLRERLAVIVRRHAAHVVVHRRQHGNRRLQNVDAGENLRRLADAGQALVDDVGPRDARGASARDPCACRHRGLRESRS